MTIASQLQSVITNIRSAEQKHDREPGSVALLAVSKTHPVSYIEQAIAAGQTSFGENYVQEALTKIKALAQLELDWHFIGSIQSNKTRAISEHFSWVHGVNREKIAARLNEHRPKHLPPLNVCIEVNISDEVSKSGVAVADVPQLAAQILQYPRLRLRGLMVIPALVYDYADQLRIYQSVSALQQDLIDSGLALDTLSMGMSNDYDAAIAAGSTIVRIGTAIFGSRQK